MRRHKAEKGTVPFSEKGTVPLSEKGTVPYYEACSLQFEQTALPAMEIIDTHCHVYPDKIAPLAMKAIDRFYEGAPPSHYDGTTGMLVREGRKRGISRFVIHSVATAPRQVSAINTFIAASMRDAGGTFIGMGTLHPDAEDPEKDFRELCSLGLYGVKLHPDTQKFRADSPGAMKIFEMCEAAGLPVCVHTGDFRYDYSNPDRIVPVLKAFPRLKMIGAHFGGWSVWDQARLALPDFENFRVDTSSSFFWLRPEEARELIHAYGSERVMFGTDYPFWTWEPELEYLRRLELEPEEYANIFSGTCLKLFGVQHRNETKPVIETKDGRLEHGRETKEICDDGR